jgi:hypothetical protein
MVQYKVQQQQRIKTRRFDFAQGRGGVAWLVSARLKRVRKKSVILKKTYLSG